MTRFNLKLSCTLTLLMLSSLTVHAADLELIPGRFLQRGEYAEQVFTLKNNSKRHFDAVYGECGIFDGDELIATSNLDFHDIPPKGEAYSFANSDRGHVSEIKCRITNIE